MNKITILPDGPYLVQGALPLAHQHIVTNAQGESLAWREGRSVAPTRRRCLCPVPLRAVGHQAVLRRQPSAGRLR